jgi:hypothetical protein
MTTENIIEKGHFLDMVYFSDYETLFLHEDKECMVYKIDNIGVISKFYAGS